MENSTLSVRRGFAIHLAVFCLCLAGMIYRFRDRLQFPVFWGEDGPYFFAEALCAGGSPERFSFTGGAGVHALLPAASTAVAIERTLAQIIVGTAPEYAPQLFFLASIFLSALILSFIVSDKFAWLIRPKWSRILLAAIFCLRSGTDEVTTNLIGFTYLGTWALALSVLQRPLPPTWILCLLWIAVPVSANTSAALAGLIAAVYWVSRNKVLFVPFMFAVFSAVLNFCLALTSPYREVAPRVGNPLMKLVGTADRYLYETFATQWVGPVIARNILGTAPAICFVLALFVFAIFLGILRKLGAEPEKQKVALGLLSIPLIFFAMHSIARADRMDSPFLNAEVALGYRHSLFSSLVILTISTVFLTAHFQFRSALARVGFRFFCMLPLLHNAIFPFIIVPGCPKYSAADWVSFQKLFLGESVSDAQVPILPMLKTRDTDECVPWSSLRVRKLGEGTFECHISGGNY